MFTDALTELVVSGKKTSTRRVMKPQPSWVSGDGKIFNDSNPPLYKAGEEVAIAQRYSAILDELEHKKFVEHNEEWESTRIRCAELFSLRDHAGFRNKMFVEASMMPHRILITAVHAERLQDISEEDCIKEGVEYVMPGLMPLSRAVGLKEMYPFPQDAFRALIDMTCGKGTFDRNPWVFVYDFKLVQ